MGLKFSFTIEDEATGETIAADYTSFDLSQISQDGAVETIDIHTGCALRGLKARALRGEFER